jgi:hypothetical protein
MPSLYPVNPDKLLTVVQEARADLVARNRLLERLATALKAQDGKLLNKRIGTAVQEALPLYSVYYEDWQLQVWGGRGSGKLKWDSRITINLKAGSTGKHYDHNATLNGDITRYMRNPERENQMLYIQQDIPRLAEEYNAALKALEAAKKAFGPAEYLLEDAWRR